MRLLLTVPFLVLAIPCAAQQWDREPDSYRGVKWGTALADVPDELLGRTECLCISGPEHHLCKPRPEKDPKKTPASRTCFDDFEVGQTHVHSGLMFVAERLAGATMAFDSTGYEALRDVFVEKYGPPKTTKHEELQNRMGARFDNEMLSWAGKDVEIDLARYGSDLTKGHASISTAVARAYFAAQIKAEKAKGADSF